MVQNSSSETHISLLRTRYDNIYALRENGQINVYSNYPFTGIQLENVVILDTSIRLAKGLDIDSEGYIWSIDINTNDLIRITPEGYFDSRVKAGSISNFCFSPVDLTTTCDGLLVVADLCGNGRFFVLRHNGSAVYTVQYNDGRTMVEAPKQVSTGPGGYLYFLGLKNVTVFGRSSKTAPFEQITSFQHGLQFPTQLFVDQTGTIFISCSSASAGIVFS